LPSPLLADPYPPTSNATSRPNYTSYFHHRFLLPTVFYCSSAYTAHQDLRLLSERRDDLAGERTRILNWLYGLLGDLLPGGAPTDLTADKAAALLRSLRPATATAPCRRELARDLLTDLRRVDARLRDNKVQVRDALAATGSTLTPVHGLGVVLAAKILGHVGDIGRFPSQDHFASYTATAPLGRLQRQPAAAPTQHRRQPPAQRRPTHHRSLPSPRPRTRPQLLPAQAQRRQDPS
jgi:hypothetical protein